MKKKLHFYKQTLVLFCAILIITLSNLQAQTKITSSQFIGSTTAWDSNDPQDISVAFDGSFDTFIDGWENWGFVGYDFGEGNEKQIETFKYAPRSGWASRLVNSQLRGSNSSDFLNDFDLLYTITADPTEDILTEAVVSSTTAYRYVYWFGASGTYSNISEFQLFDAVPTQLTGTAIGQNAGSQWCDICTYNQAFDNDFSTYVEGPVTIGFIGYDFGAGNTATISSWKFAPRTGWASRMENTELRGSNNPDYLTNYVVLNTITTSPTEGVLTENAVTDTESYRYIYWYGTDNSYGNISEFELYGAVTLSAVDFEISNTSFKVFPNPSNGGNFKLKLNSSNLNALINIKIYNLLGQNILNKNFTPKSTEIEINENLKSGLYIVKIDNKTTKRLTVK